MTGFDADWLTLREPLDAASRAAQLVDALPGAPVGGLARQVVDLGAGTGANLRYLAPRIGGPQDWVLVDHDPALRDRLAPRMQAWAATGAAKVLRGAAGAEAAVAFRGAGFDCRADYAMVDLASRLDEVSLPHGCLVTGSALLDLVSPEWLRALADRCTEARAAVLMALTYDGRIECSPAEPEDALIRRLVNRHQEHDKGFGPALGPAAAPSAAALFGERGYSVHSTRSDWLLGPEHAELQRALLEGWLIAAREIESGEAEALAGWHRRRLDHLAAGRSEIVVGHIDLVAIPAW